MSNIFYNKYGMREKISEGFCVLPFFGIEYPNKTACCLLKPGHDLSQVKKEMLENKKPDACSACWKLEEKNLKSDRQLKNMALDVFWDRDIRCIEEDCHQGNYFINHYKFNTSNLCNAACVTCNKYSSTTWGKLENSMNLESISRENLDKMIDYKTAVAINFTGGESLLNKNNFYILEKLLDANNTNCFIQFTTNGSIRLSSEQKKLVGSFKKLNFGVSIDGTEKVFEYMRYPLEWNLVVDNIKQFKQLTPMVSANTTTSNLNIIYFVQLIQWLEENNLEYHYNPVFHPTYFRPQALPQKIKESIRQMHKDNTFIGLLLNQPHTAQDDQDFAKCLVEVQRQDNLKKIDIKDYLPEFCSLVGI